jgi:hypothetical protein
MYPDTQSRLHEDASNSVKPEAQDGVGEPTPVMSAGSTFNEQDLTTQDRDGFVNFPSLHE